MKPTTLIPPAVALLLVASWVVPQRFTMAAVETESARLKNNITAAKAPATTRSDPLEKRRRIIEWTKLATHLPSNPMLSSICFSGALPDPRVSMRFRQQMMAMSTDEIIATLDEVAALNLPAESQENLEWTLMEALTQKDPGLALRLMADRDVLESQLYSALITRALQTWGNSDFSAPEAWFDQQIAAGKFSVKSLKGSNGFRHNFESKLIAMLLPSAPEAAARRLAALPENERSSVLRMYSLSVVPEALQLAHAKLIRAYMPLQQQAETIASQVPCLIHRGDYSAATAYFERINATPAERAASILKSVQHMSSKNLYSDYFTRDDFDDFRAWVADQAPDTLAVATGKALGEAAHANRRMKFSAAADLAVEYNAASGNDEVLATFLTSLAALHHQPVARALADTISDEKRRAEILDLLK